MFSVDHYAISVSDIDRSVDFYQKLGFEIIKNYVAPDHSVQIVNLVNQGFILELFCYEKRTGLPEFVGELESDLRMVGSKHFGLHVDDLNAAAEYLVKAGILDEMPVISQGRLGRPYFFVRDPDGIFVEIIAKN